MKHGILLFFVLCILVCNISAQLPSNSYIALFTDEARTSWCVENISGFQEMELWFWILPSERGIQCIEYHIEYPPNTIQSTVTINLDLSPDCAVYPEGCDIINGSFCFGECVMEWVWAWHQLSYIIDFDVSTIEVQPHPDSGSIQVATCEEGYPFEPCRVLSKIYINSCGPLAVKNSSWGAIKALYED